MTFQALLTHRVTIYRKAATTGIKKEYSSVATNVTCLVQPLADTEAPVQGGTYGKAFRGYFLSGANVQPNDKLTDDIGKEYRVQGVKYLRYGGTPHLECLLVQEVKAVPNQ